MAQQPLSAEAQKQAILFSATLKKLLGHGNAAAQDLRAILLKTPLLQVEADELLGTIANDQGELWRAEADFRRAIEIAEQLIGVRLGHADGIAKTSNNLGRIHTTIGEIDAAKGYFAEAEAIYRRIGKVTAIDGMRINRAFLCNLTGTHAEAVTTLQRFLAEKAVANEALSPLMTALLHQNLAEAYLGLGDLEKAEAAV